MNLKHLAIATAAFGFSACGGPSSVDSDKDIVTEMALQDVPASVKALVNETQADFVISEVFKKERGLRIYYDVEGELSDGSEIEFDILMSTSGPEIVEIQRDIVWNTVPDAARALVEAANKNDDDISRVIESTQTDGAIIYEIFIDGHSSDPRFEVWSKESNYKLLSTRWEH